MAVAASAGVPVQNVKEFSMAELVERTGVAAATVRYYLASGLLPPPRRAQANRFYYDERHVEVVRLIRLLQDRRSLSLDTIGKMLPDLLPDLTGAGGVGSFRPEMWAQLFATHFAAEPPSPADRLRDAGMAAFARHGYADVSVDDVCRATGIAKGSFYRHYASKEELFFATVVRLADVVAEGIAAAGADADAAFVADALGPHLAIVLDVASMASQRRPGYGRALRDFVRVLADAVDATDAEAVVRDALGRAVAGLAIGRAASGSVRAPERDAQ